MKIELEYTIECFLELLIHERVNEWIDDAVSVAKKIAKIEEMMVCTTGRISTKALNESADMIRRPAKNKGSVKVRSTLEVYGFIFNYN